MKINELRLGNWVKCKNNYAKVENMSSRFIMDTSDYVGVRYINEGYTMCVNTAFTPIEITEEMLVNLFGKPRINEYKFDIYTVPTPTIGIEIQDRRKSPLPTPTICVLKFGVHVCDIEYLHQLQNIYYLLIGKELEVSL